MYSLRQIALDDKISQQVSIEVFTQIYPTEMIQTLVEQDLQVQKKQRRVRHFVPVSVVWFLLMMALWTRLAQARVWDKLTHKLVVLHPDETLKVAGASALSYQRQLLGDDLFSADGTVLSAVGFAGGARGVLPGPSAPGSRWTALQRAG